MSLVMPHLREPRGRVIGPDLTVSGSRPFLLSTSSFIAPVFFKPLSLFRKAGSGSGVFRRRSLETFSHPPHVRRVYVGTSWADFFFFFFTSVDILDRFHWPMTFNSF